MDELQLEGITKGYLGVQALKGVSLSVKRGSIHALAGQNGAGKSTLVKILSGAETPDGGTIRLGGEIVRFREPNDAQAAGIQTIYQELSLVPSLSVAENIFLGRLPRKGGAVDWQRMYTEARTALARVGFDLDVRRPVASFSVAEQQAVELAKAFDAKLELFHAFYLEVPPVYGGFGGDFTNPQDLLEPVRQAAEAAMNDLVDRLAAVVHHVGAAPTRRTLADGDGPRRSDRRRSAAQSAARLAYRNERR